MASYVQLVLYGGYHTGAVYITLTLYTLSVLQLIRITLQSYQPITFSLNRCLMKITGDT